MRELLTAGLLAGLSAGAPAQQEAPLSFVVLGHLRGDPVGDTTVNPLLDEVVASCARLRPDLVFLTGDSVWGDYWNIPADPAVVEREWEVLDAALARIGAPVHRVPGNHDISDLATRDLFFRRYGRVPAAVRHGRVLFLLLSSAWIPADGDRAQARHVHGVPIDRGQLGFVERELARDEHDHAFVLVHHLLWWKDDAYWWQDVHPVLVGKKVRAVIGGDYGPTKYSHRTADGITYVHCSVAAEPDLEMLRINEHARLLSHQLDCFLHFTVRGQDVRFDVRTVGATDPKHTPARWHEVHALDPLDYVYYSVWATTRRRWLLALGLAGGGFAAGLGVALAAVWLGRRFRRRAAP